MENVKVTVYLSTFNQAPYIAQALDSILAEQSDDIYKSLEEHFNDYE